MWAPQSRAFLYLSWVFWLIYQISFKRKNHLDRSPGQLHQCQNSDRLGPGKYVTLFRLSSQLTSPIWFRISSISGSTDLCQHSSAWTTLQPWEIQIFSDVRLVRPAPFPSPGHREPSQCLEGQPFTYNLVFFVLCGSSDYCLFETQRWWWSTWTTLELSSSPSSQAHRNGVPWASLSPII